MYKFKYSLLIAEYFTGYCIFMKAASEVDPWDQPLLSYVVEYESLHKVKTKGAYQRIVVSNCCIKACVIFSHNCTGGH